MLLFLQMGPSGSGKTTLLDLLAGRKTVGNTEGKILFAGNTPSKQFLRRYTGYLEQFGECSGPLAMLLQLNQYYDKYALTLAGANIMCQVYHQRRKAVHV